SFDEPLEIIINIDGEFETYIVNYEYEYNNIYDQIKWKLGYDKLILFYDRESNYITVDNFYRNIYLELNVVTGNYEDYNTYIINSNIYYIRKGEPVDIKLNEYHIGYNDESLNKYEIGDVIEFESDSN